MIGVKWSQAHVDELDSLFPEVVDTSDVNELLKNSGKRTVIHYLKSRVLQQQHRLNNDH